MAYTTIDDPSAHFHTLTYSGDSNDDRNITNSANAGDFKPDWLWIKERTSTSSNQLIDSTRGARYSVLSDSANAEDDDTNRIQSFNTNGFQVGTASTVNENSQTYVAWQWKANGGTTSSNGNGSITSTVQANTTAGFSIVTYAGSNSASTVGHGLGAVPEVIFVKNRDASANWKSYHKPILETHTLSLNGNGAKADQESFNDTAPTSTVFSLLGNTDNVNRSGEDFVAYCFTPIKGYSKFGSYKGTGDANGTFVYTGFKPAWLLFKLASASGEHWRIFDNKRSTFNVTNKHLFASVTSAESAETGCDFLSNGFKWRNSDDHQNGSGKTYIYLAFAEHPFVSSKGAPVTAR